MSTRVHELPADVADAGAGDAAAAAPDVRCVGIRKIYGDVVAVDHVDLEVVRGEFFTLLGPSGSGKTTTLRLIAGFERPDAGRIELRGLDVATKPPYERPVNTVFQDYALFPHMTVGDNVAYGLRVRGVGRRERRQRADEALELVRLGGYGKRRPAQLSGGQRQRVALARAIVNRPEVLLLDEPLGALDLKLRQEMQTELKRIQGEVGITFIYVTHDQEEALTMSDRIAVFNGGRIEQVGTPSEVYERPATEFVAGFVGVSNILERDGRKITVRPEKIRILGDGDEPARAKPGPAFPSRSSASPPPRQGDQPARAKPGPAFPSRSSASPPPRQGGAAEGEPGTIRDAVYVGMVTRYTVELDAGGVLQVVEQNLDTSFADVSSAKGQRVRLLWSPENVFEITEGT